MRRRQRRSAQLTFVMEFPAGDQVSTSSTNGSLWSQIYPRSSPHQYNPPSYPTAENGCPSGSYLPPTTISSTAAFVGQPNRFLVICQHWIISVTSYCTSCVARQRVYGLSEQQHLQDSRFTGANAPSTRQQQVQQVGAVATSGLHHTDGVFTGGPHLAPDDRCTAPSPHQQQYQYRFSGASAPYRPGYEHGSSNSDSPPYLPSREHAAAANTWSGHQYQDRPV
jgi:hypothetical protein